MASDMTISDPAIAPPADGAAPLPAQSGNVIQREVPDTSEAKKALVRQWAGKVKKAKTFHEDTFKKMRALQDFLSGIQWESPEASKSKYQANITQRHISQRVAALYAKNPKFLCKRRQTLDFTIWDESAAAFQQIQGLTQSAIQSGQIDPTTGKPILPPLIQQLVEDITQGLTRRGMLDRVARTMEVVMKYSTDEQRPSFKRQMKQLIRRVCTCKVGYVKVGYQRQMAPNPETTRRIQDCTEKLERLKQLAADVADEKIREDDPQAEELRQLLAQLQEEPEQIVSEGLTFDFPASTSIIIDPDCTHLTTFLGANYVAQEYVMSKDRVKQIYNVDIGESYTKFTNPGQPEKDADGKQIPPAHCCVWEVWDKITQQVFTIVDGYADYLKEPASPEVKISRFWPWFVLAFNETENDKTIFPQSDVELIEPMQREYNRARESLREHRNANKPKTASASGVLSDEDKQKLASNVAHAHLTLNGLTPQQDIRSVIMAIPNVPIDPPLYDTEYLFTDITRTLGQSDAAVGNAQPGVTATGDSIAESNRMTSTASNIDDLDDLLRDMAEASGQILFAEMDEATVKKFAGIGAIWPKLSRQEISDQLLLTIEAGSSGRPNAAAEMAKVEKAVPLLIQIPGISPDWVAKLVVKALDADIDVTDALGNVAQSIVAMNSMKAAQAGAAPSAQGPQGGLNAPTPPAPTGNPGAHNIMPNPVAAAVPSQSG